MQFHLWVNLHVGFAFYCGLAINLATTTELPSPNQFICRSHYFRIFICTLDRPVKFVTICFLIYCCFATIYRLNIFHYSLLKPMVALDTIVNYRWMVIINFSQCSRIILTELRRCKYVKITHLIACRTVLFSIHGITNVIIRKIKHLFIY